MGMPTLTVRALPLNRRPTGQEDESYDTSTGRKIDLTMDDGTVVEIVVDGGTLLIRSDDPHFRVATYPNDPSQPNAARIFVGPS